MAGWISSKLKVAENLLHQIDQQAAESLGKNERKQFDGLDLETSPKPTGSGGNVSIRDQLKKNTPSEINHESSFRKLSSNNNSNISPKYSSDGGSRNIPKVRAELNPSSSALKDSDWTELLSTPDKLSTSTSKKSIVNGVLGGKKVGGRVRNVGLNVKGKGTGNGNSAGTVRKASNGRGFKENGGEVEVERDRRSDGDESSRVSYESPRVSGVDSEDRSPQSEGLESNRSSGKLGSQEGKDEVEGESLNSKKPVVIAEAHGLGSNGREGVHDDGKFRGTSLAADKTRVDIVNYAPGDLKKDGSSSGSEDVSDSESGSTSDSETEREREERIQRRRQLLAARAAAKAAETIKEQENLVARLEGEKQSLEKILEEQAKQAAQEASELQSTMMEMMEAAELEKQKHNLTRMEVLSRLAKLETTNADLAKSLATTQWNLEIEVNRAAELRQLVEVKEVVCEDLKRRISGTYQTKQSLTYLIPSKGIELEKEMLVAEHSLLTERISGLQEKAAKLEANIDFALKEMENPTEVEVELKRRLDQMTDHLIQKQSQVEALSSDKAMLLFRIEAVSRLLDENRFAINAGDLAGSSREDLEAGTREGSGSKLQPMFEAKIQSGKQHLGSFLKQADAIFSAGAVFLARNPPAKLWSLVYLVCLHIWVLYILFSRPWSAEDAIPGSVLSIDNMNNVNSV